MGARNKKAEALSKNKTFLCYNGNVQLPKSRKEGFMPRKNDDTSSLSHTKWNCQYHIVFTPKYRRKAIYAKLRADIGKYLRRLCEYKGVEIIEAHAMADHIHMLVKIPPKISISSFMVYLKGKSSLKEYKDPFTGK